MKPLYRQVDKWTVDRQKETGWKLNRQTCTQEDIYTGTYQYMQTDSQADREAGTQLHMQTG